MSFTEYIVVFVSFIFAYVAAEFFNGWGRFLRNRKEITLHWDYILLTILIFVIFIDFWWLSFSWYKGLTRDIYSLFAFLPIPLIYYFYSILLFPDKKEMENFDSEVYFMKRNLSLYVLFIILMLVSAFNQYLFEQPTLLVPENIVRLMAIIISGIFIIYRKKLLLFRILLIVAYGVLVLNFVMNR